ncbi:MAG: phosphoglycerate kinase [Oscillospiraceae bacterium]|nr:phosphoglycerate kinase [Oscillospiraceae bacterium]
MNYNKMTVTDINAAGKRVLVRCDFNVPQDKDGAITDDKRIRESLPTIRQLIGQGARVILCSHLGRPKGEFNMKYSLAPVAARLTELLDLQGQAVELAADVIGPDATAKAAALKDGQVMLLENVRFHKEEEQNDPGFSKSLALLAEIYVNDAFGTAHRAHASTAGAANYLPAVCGFLIKKEIDIMGGALQNPKRPFVAVLGGAKVSDKIGVINHLLDMVDTIIIGGAMAYTFIKADNGTIGASRCEDDRLDYARDMLVKAREKGVKLMLPEDNMCAREFKADAEARVFSSTGIEDGWMGLDIGPEAIKRFSEAVSSAGTVIWNGPMGVFEFDRFAEGTRSVARALADSAAVSIIGGGDSAAAVEQLGFAAKMTHISTGGGASLEFLEGLELPGIACLNDR